MRDQVFSIRFSPEVFIASIRAIRRSSTNGPFLLERLIASYPSASSSDDVAVGVLALLAGAVAERRHAPRGDRMAAGRGRALAAAVGWSTGLIAVPRVCGRTPMWRLRPALPILTFWWSVLPIVPTVARHSPRTIRISPEGSRASRSRPPWPAAGRRRRRPAPSGRRARASARRCGRRCREACSERQAIADPHVHVVPDCTVIPTRSRCGSEDVTLLAVGVVQQRDVGGAVRVVLDVRDLRRDAVLAALEVDLAVQPLGAAATMARGLAAVPVAAAGLLQPLGERLLGLTRG